MEAIGGAASILQLAGVAIGSFQVIHDVVTRYQDAPKQMMLLDRDMDNLVQILTRIEVTHKTASANDPDIRAIFDNMRSAINECYRDLVDLQRYTSKIRIGPGDQRSDKVWKKLKIMVNEKEFQGVKERISHNVTRMGLQQSLINQQLNVSVRQTVRQGQEEINKGLEAVGRDVKQTTESIQELNSTSAAGFSDNSRRLRELEHRVIKLGDSVTNRMDEVIAINGQIVKSSNNQKIENGVAYIRESLTEAQLQAREMLYMKLIKWLSKLDFREIYKDLLRRVHPGTGQWLLQLPLYREFEQDKASSLIWCTAKPGFGKSSLASIVSRDLAERATKDPLAAFLCAFIDKRDPRTLDSTSLVANLLKQLCWELHTQSLPPPDSLLKFFIEGKDRGNKLSFEEAKKFFNQTASYFRKIYLVVDGLDEFPEESLKHVVEILHGFGSSSKPVFKVLVMSRVSNEIRLGLKAHQHLKMTPAMNQGDINSFLHAIIGERGERPRNQDLRMQVVKTLANRSDGMFQYIKFQVKALEDTIDDKSLWDAVSKFPAGLDGVYQDILEKVNDQGDAKRDLAWKVFIWTVHAVRPLTLSELSEALCVKPGITEIDEDSTIDPHLITAVCKGLVISDDDEQVKADHTSIHEFLTRKINEKINPVGGYSVSETSLAYLLFEEFSMGPCSNEGALKLRLEHHPFLSYCALFWQEHIRGHAETLHRDLLMDFVGCFPAVESCWQVYHYVKQNTQDFPKAGSVLHVFARCGFQTINQLPINKDMLTKQAKGGGGTPLHAAAWGGHLNAVDFLLSKVKDEQNKVVIDVDARNDSKWTPLHLAIFNGHRAVMDRLIAAGAAVNVEDERTGNYPLHLASFGQRWDIVQSLLEHGAKVSVKNTEGLMPLYVAITFNRPRTIEILLDHKAEIFNDEPPNDAPSLFFQAAATGSTELVALLNRRVPASSRKELLSGSLSAAVHAKDLQMITFLINKGADVNFIFRGRAPLHIAARRGYPETLKLLLASGGLLEMKTQAMPQATALAIAAASGKADCVDILLSHGANIRGVSQMGSTLLDCVCEHEDEEVVLKLINVYNLAEMFKVGGEGALAVAAGKGHVRVVSLLLDVGYGPNYLGASHELNLDSATVDKPGIAISIEQSEKTRVKRGALHAAAASGHLDVINLLYSFDADLNLMASNGYSPLHEAATNGHEVVVEWLLNKKAIPCAKDADDCTAQELAEFEGHTEVAEMLRKIMDELHPYGKVSRCPYHTYELGQHDMPLPGMDEDVIPDDMPLEKGLLNVNGRDSSRTRRRSSLGHNTRSRRNSATGLPIGDISGYATPLTPSRSVISLVDLGPTSPPPNSAIVGTPLQLAAYYGQDDVVQMLLKEGTDPHAEVPEGTAHNTLHLAIARDRYQSAELLLANGVDANAVDGDGYTPLAYATESGNEKMARLLIKHGADVNKVAVAKANQRPLEIAILNGHNNVLGVLINCGARLDKVYLSHTPLMLATSLGHQDIVYQLIECGVDVNSNGIGDFQSLRAVHIAVIEKQVAILRILLDSGAEVDPESSDPTPLTLAACMDDVELVRLLAQRGADVNRYCEPTSNLMASLYDSDALHYHGQLSVLHFAASKGATASTAILLQHGADVNARCTLTNSTPVHLAAQSQDLNILHVLYEAGADLNAVDNWGWSPLFAAMMKGFQASASELIRLAPMLAISQSNNLPGFALAAYLQQTTVIRQILQSMGDSPWKLFCLQVLEDNQEAIADMLMFFSEDLPTDSFLQWTPVFLAVLLERKELITLIDTLWWKNPLPFAQTDRYGMTPLHWAAAAGLDDMVRTLVNMQYPDRKAKDIWGRTPEQLALFSSTKAAFENSPEQLFDLAEPPRGTSVGEGLRSWVPPEYLEYRENLSDNNLRTNLFMVVCDSCRSLINGVYYWCKNCKAEICDECVHNRRTGRCIPSNWSGHKFHHLRVNLFMISKCQASSTRNNVKGVIKPTR